MKLKNALPIVMPIFMLFSRVSFAQEMDLIAHLGGHSILALSSEDRVSIRSHYRNFSSIEQEQLESVAMETCKNAGLSKVRKFSTEESFDAHVWSREPGDSGQRIIPVQSLKHRRTNFYPWVDFLNENFTDAIPPPPQMSYGKVLLSPFKTAFVAGSWPVVAASLISPDSVRQRNCGQNVKNGGWLCLGLVAAPVTGAIGLAIGTANAAVSLVGYTCEKLYDYHMGVYGNADGLIGHLVFSQLSCESDS